MLLAGHAYRVSLSALTLGAGGEEGAKQKEKDWLEDWPLQKFSSA
jgi:hypothetical protein